VRESPLITMLHVTQLTANHLLAAGTTQFLLSRDERWS